MFAVPDSRRVAERERLGDGFGRLWSAAAGSNLADGVTLVLLPLIALRVADGPGEVALVTVAATAAWPAFGLLAGRTVDRFDRQRLLLAVSAGRAAVLFALACAALADGVSLSVLIAVALLLGIAETLADTCLTAMLPAYVPAAARGRANARMEAATSAANQLVGPVLAGLLVALGAASASATTAFLYVAAAVAVFRLPRPQHVVPRRSQQAPSASDAGVLAGVKLLWNHPMLRRLTLFTAGMNLVWGMWTALFVVHAVSPGPLGLTSAEFGMVLSAMAVGGLLAAGAVTALSRRFGARRLMLVDVVGTVLLVAPSAAGLGTAAVVAGVVAAGAGSTVWRAIAATIRHNAVGDALAGRVYAASRVVSWGVLPVAAGLAGVAAEAVGVRTTFAVASALALLLVALFLLAFRRHDISGAYAAEVRPPDACSAARTLDEDVERGRGGGYSCSAQ